MSIGYLELFIAIQRYFVCWRSLPDHFRLCLWTMLKAGTDEELPEALLPIVDSPRASVCEYTG